jgi:formamidopyrimidine-DNA glycosylase
MIEIPESMVLAEQLNRVLAGRTVTRVIPWQHPHKLAFIYKDPASYPSVFKGKTVSGTSGFGSWVELTMDDCILAVSEGTSLLYTRDENALPQRHQMLLLFDDGSYLCAQVKMYGAVVGALTGEYDNHYYLVAREKPGVFSKAFTPEYFRSLIDEENLQNLSLKAFLATEQRIPGLGNGVLQDILFNSRLHPREKVANTSPSQRDLLYRTLVSTLKEMKRGGGRDTEKDLFGKAGGYRTRMSKNTVNQPCQVCAATIEKASYMGGSVYYCPVCQSLS